MTQHTRLRCKGKTRCKWAKSGSTNGPFLRLLFTLLVLICFQRTVSPEPFGGSSVGIHIPGGNLGVISESRCPRVCSCNGLTVDCSHRGLTQVPRKISAEVERL